MQHRHMVYGKLHIRHDLFLDQNVNDNAYSTPYCHKDFDLDHKMIMLVIVSYYNTFLLLFVQHQHYPEHDTLCMYIFLYNIFFCILPDQ